MVLSSDNHVCCSIGGHILLISGSESLPAVLSLAGINVFFEDAGAHPSCWPVDLDSIRYREPDFKSVYEFVSCGYSKIFGVDGDRLVFVIKGLNDDVRFRMEYVDNHIYASTLTNCDLMRFALWFAFNMFGSHNGIWGVHSSCIVYDRCGVLFLGESGTGKSTHARLWTENFDGAHLLNDDCPAVSTENRHTMVYGSPWSGKTPCFHNKAFQLAAVVRLSQASENSMRKLDAIGAIAALFPSFPPAFAKIDQLRDRMLSSISKIILQVPVYHLECLPDVSAAELARRIIFNV